MKAITTRETTMLGRKKSTFRTELPETGWQVSGVSSKEDGERLLTQALARQNEFGQARRYLRGRSTTWALYYANGWQYDIVHDEDPSKYSGCVMPANYTRTQAREAFEKHFREHEEDCTPKPDPKLNQ